MTDLFVVASGLPPTSLVFVIPPACRRTIEAAPPCVADGDDLVVSLPECMPRRPARHLLPCVSALTITTYAFRFELSVKGGGDFSPWVAGETVGAGTFAPMTSRTPALASDVDVFLAPEPVTAVRVRLRLRVADREAFAAAPWLVSLSASDGVTVADDDGAPAARLRVPALSQMEEPEAVRLRICSPTSVAMVLRFWGEQPALAAVVDEIFHPALDRYGVWPSAIRAAARHGVAGYLLRFPDWRSAAWCVGQGMPVIASIRYGEGELTGAPIAKTDGHLVVVTGCEGDVVMVNDPAAPTQADVPRRYRLDEFRRAWLDRGGVGYVLFKPALGG